MFLGDLKSNKCGNLYVINFFKKFLDFKVFIKGMFYCSVCVVINGVMYYI